MGGDSAILGLGTERDDLTVCQIGACTVASRTRHLRLITVGLSLGRCRPIRRQVAPEPSDPLGRSVEGGWNLASGCRFRQRCETKVCMSEGEPWTVTPKRAVGSTPHVQEHGHCRRVEAEAPSLVRFRGLHGDDLAGVD